MALTRRMTYEDLLAQPNDGCLHELVRGTILRMPPPKGIHGHLESALIGAIDRYLYSRARALLWEDSQGLRARDLLVGYLGGGEQGIRFSLPDDPDQVRGADLLYLTPEQVARHRAILDDEYIPEVPALLAEVISPSDRAGYVDRKMADYLAGGAQLVWCLYPARRVVEVHRPAGAYATVDYMGALGGEDVLPGFSVSLAYLFG